MKSWSAGKTTLCILAVLFILAANFAIWLSGSIFDRRAFTKTTVDVIKRPETRNAISAEIVGTAFKDVPAVRSAIGEPIESAISGLLASDRFEPALSGLAEKTNILLTAKQPQAVIIDVSGIKGFLKPIAGALDGRFRKQIIAGDLPDSITLIKKGEIPSTYGWASIVLWVGPILGLIGLAFLFGLVWSATAETRPQTLKAIGATLAIGSLVFMILIRIMRAPVVAAVQSSNGKIIVGNLFDAFSGRLTSQTWLLAVTGLAVVGTGYLLARVRQTEPPAERGMKEAA